MDDTVFLTRCLKRWLHSCVLFTIFPCITAGGNAGLAAAFCAKELGLPITVVVPQTTPTFIVDKLREEGAEVEVVGKVGGVILLGSCFKPNIFIFACAVARACKPCSKAILGIHIEPYTFEVIASINFAPECKLLTSCHKTTVAKVALLPSSQVWDEANVRALELAAAPG